MIKFWKTLTCTAIAALGLAGVANGQVVISQVYGAGGNAGAVFNADYVELFNQGTGSVDISNWSIQYASSTGTNWSKVDVPAGMTIAGSSYFLIKVSPTGANGAALTADVDGTAITASAVNGKFALMNTNTMIAGGTSCPSGGALVDLVGYGTANCFQGTGAAPALSASVAAFRGSGGCTNSGNNNSDFATATPAPRNTTSPTNVCSGSSGPSGSNSTATSSSCPNTTVTFSVTVTPGANPTITSVVADFTSIGGASGVAMSNGGSGLVYTSVQTIAASTTAGGKSIGVVITDGAALTGNATISYTVNNCTLGISSSSASPVAVCSGSQITFNVTVRKNTITGQGPSTGIVVALDLTNVNAFAPLQQNMTDLGDDPNNADRRLFTLVHTVPAGQLSGSGSVPITVTDAQNNLFNGTGAAPFPFNVTLIGPCTPSTSTVVISQVYGGGGNQGAPYQRDYVELFNRSSGPVDISGWSLQYAGATAAFDAAFAIPAGTIIQPGNYFLIGAGLGSSCAGSTPCGDPLPVAVDADGTTLGSLGSQQGKVILLSGVSAPLGMGSDVCPVPVSGGAVIQDFIGYGGANCREGITNAPGLSNTTAAFRHGNGCQDNDQSAADFAAAAPAPRNSASPANPCVATACCQNDGSCVVTAPGGTCNGTLQVGQSTCPPVPACPQPTVCCRAAVCTVELPADCVATGGGVVGVGNTCGVNTCGAPANDHCCRGTTCNPVASGTCTGVIAGSNSIVVTSCGAGNTFATCCYADFNHDGVQSIDDLFLYFNAYFTSNPLADFGGDGTSQPTIDDLFLYINAYFGTCS